MRNDHTIRSRSTFVHLLVLGKGDYYLRTEKKTLRLHCCVWVSCQHDARKDIWSAFVIRWILSLAVSEEIQPTASIRGPGRCVPEDVYKSSDLFANFSIKVFSKTCSCCRRELRLHSEHGNTHQWKCVWFNSQFPPPAAHVWFWLFARRHTPCSSGGGCGGADMYVSLSSLI